MIALGSCTMKLNAAAMLPLNALWNSIHPFAPLDQVKGYTTMLKS
jgi:glycine dehydrogenase